MQTPQTLNLGSPGSDTPDQDFPRPEDEFTEIRELIDQTRSDVRRTRIELDRQQNAQESFQRRGKALSVVIGSLIVMLAGALWFAYPALQDQRPQMLNLQNGAKVLGDRVKAVEGKVAATSGFLPGLADRMDQLQTSMKSNLDAARTQARAAATQAGQRIREDVNKSMQMIQSRLAGVESNQQEASQHVTQLQDQIAGLKKEIVSMRQESSAATEKIKQLEDEQQARAKTLSGLDQRMASNQVVVNTLVSQINRKRVDFNISDRRTREIAPGIYLTIRSANLGKQEVDGTLQLSAESRMISIRGQGVQKPMIFYTSGESRPMELVVTQVAKNRVSGYLSMPIPAAAAQADSTQ